MVININIQLLTIEVYTIILYWIRYDIHQRIPLLTVAIAEVNIGIQWWVSMSYPIPQ